MKKRLYAQSISDRPVPIGFLTYRLPSGRVEAFAVDYLGVVCSSPAVISLSCMEVEGEGPDPAGDFAVCLPAEELLHRPDFVGTILAVASLDVVGGKVPLIAGCPVQIECRRREETQGAGPPLLRGEVTALLIDGRIRPRERLGDLSGLARCLASRRSGSPVNIPWELLPGASREGGAPAQDCRRLPDLT